MTFQPSTQPVLVRTPKKRVQFNPTAFVLEYEPPQLTDEERSKLYFSKDDMDMTLQEVKEIVLSKQQSYSTCCIGGDCDDDISIRCEIHNIVVAAEADDVIRGIELQAYPRRSQNKLIGRRAVMKYQKHLNEKRINLTQEQKAKTLRAASEKFSAWSRMVALETARLDSIRAYDEEYMIPLSGHRIQCAPFPKLPLKRKESHDSRSVASSKKARMV